MLLCIVLLMLRGGNVALSKKKPKLNLGDVDYILNVSCHNDKEVQVSRCHQIHCLYVHISSIIDTAWYKSLQCCSSYNI